jgi:hypothetical protein
MANLLLKISSNISRTLKEKRNRYILHWNFAICGGFFVGGYKAAEFQKCWEFNINSK